MWFTDRSTTKKEMKNWTVVTQPVKDEHAGLCSYINYLIADSHKSHRGRARIVPIHNSANGFINHCLSEITNRNLTRAKAKKGGRNITSYGQSFVFSLPPDIKLSDMSWHNVAKFIFTDLANYLNIDKQTLLKNCFINFHDQKNQHVNLVVSKVINGEVQRDIQRKGLLSFLKKSFNAAVLKYSNKNYQDYVPQTKRSKRYQQYYFNQNKVDINQRHVMHDATPCFYVEDEKPPVNKKKVMKLTC